MKLLNDIPDLSRLSFDDSSDESSYDDNDSIDNISFDSSSKSKRVSFCNTLVTNVKYRPVTKHSDKSLLYYTTAETDRFRQIYREERAREYRCSISKHIQNGGLSLEKGEEEEGEEEPSSPIYQSRRRISRIIVNPKKSSKGGSFYDDFPSYILENDENDNDDICFDDERFWSGSITWY